MSGLEEAFQWLAPDEPSLASRILAVVLALVVLVLGILVHRSTTFPGPLSTAERRAALLPRSRRLGALGIYWATAITWMAALAMLVLAPRRPALLLLESRAQRDVLMVEEMMCAKDGFGHPETPFRALDRGQGAFDLRPIVDDVVRRCGQSCATYRGTPEEREALAALVREAVLSVAPRRSSSGDPTSPPAPLPDGDPSMKVDRWVLETIEVSVIQLEMVRLNAREVRVLPGASFESRSSWDVARTFLGRPGTSFRLCGRAADRLPDRPVVTRLAQAHWSADGQITGWALVEGRFPPGAAEETIPLSLQLWGAVTPGPVPAADAALTLVVKADGFTSRLARVCLGSRCDGPDGKGKAVDLEEIRAIAVARGAAVRLRAPRRGSGPDVWAPVRLAVPDDRPPDLVVSGTRPEWLRLFYDAGTAPRFAALRAELDAMGLRVPRLVHRSGELRAPMMLVSVDWLVIAVDVNAARRGAGAAGAMASAKASGVGRVRRPVALGPMTVFSLSDLPVSPVLRAAGDLETLATVRGDDTPLSEGTGVEQPVVLEGADATGRPFLVIGAAGLDGALVPGSARYEPTTAWALVRLISWAAQRVRDGASGAPPEFRIDQRGASATATPLMTPSDAMDAARLELRPWDAWWVAALCVCLLVASVTALRRAPAMTR
ncbi:MAG TPA: hypothetical protein VFA20_32810 [Myxococcaceae bacterium]|nr:hypothetical protein [Myxococcaceae bacterium]